MRTENERLLDILGEDNVSFVIPAYQRLYSWKERQCKELWLDVHRASKGDRTHFVGTLLYSDGGVDEAGIRRLVVIDGQQRLTTLTLMILAFSRYLKSHDMSIDGVDAYWLESRYLHVGPPCSPSCKLVLSRDDRKTLFSVVDGEELPVKVSDRIIENLAQFEGYMAEDAFEPELFWRGLNRLFVIKAHVDTSDNAQLIFERLNSKGMPLTTADLVRNYLLLAETHEEQARLYDEYWGPIEGMFAPDPGSLRLDNAIQGWLSVRFRKVRAKGAGEVYSVFKQYVEDEFTGSVESLLAELRRFCLVWAENYRYHAVKKFKSAFKWANNGPQTLVSDMEIREADNKDLAEETRKKMDAVDGSL